MKKIISIILLLSTVAIAVGFHLYNESLERAASEAMAEEEQRKIEELLDKLITVETKGDFNQVHVDQMFDHVAKVEYELLKALYNSHARVKFINFPIVELPEYAHAADRLHNKVGYAGNPIVALINSHSGELGSGGVELHEIGHGVDEKVFGRISYRSDFLAIQREEQQRFLTFAYFNDPAEYFAEAFAYYYHSEQSQDRLKREAPKTYEFIQMLPDIIPENRK